MLKPIGYFLSACWIFSLVVPIFCVCVIFLIICLIPIAFFASFDSSFRYQTKNDKTVDTMALSKRLVSVIWFLNVACYEWKMTEDRRDILAQFSVELNTLNECVIFKNVNIDSRFINSKSSYLPYLSWRVVCYLHTHQSTFFYVNTKTESYNVNNDSQSVEWVNCNRIQPRSVRVCLAYQARTL